MDLRQISTFREVAEQGSLRRASARLRVAETAVSRQMRRLEQEFGVALFRRHGRGLALTPDGQAMRERLLPLVNGLVQLKTGMLSRRGEVSGQVTIGVPCVLLEKLSASLARGFIRRLGEVPLVPPSPRNPFRQKVEALAAERDVPLWVRFEAEALAPQKALALEGVAEMQASPEAVRRDLADGALCAAPVAEPEIVRTLHLALPRDRPRSVAAQHLAEAVVAEFREDGPAPRPEAAGRTAIAARQARAGQAVARPTGVAA